MSEIKLIVRPFAMGTEKEAANKVQEEANEAVHAWRSFVDVLYPITTAQKPNACMLESTHTRLADEIADTIQASCNLAARYGIDLQAAMERCEKRNRERGRYEDEDAKSCGIHDGHDRGCGGDCGAVPVGMDVLRKKTPEEMSAEELIEALYIANGGSYYRNNSCSCTKKFGSNWCRDYGTCTNCRERLLDLLKAAYEREIENAHKCDDLQQAFANEIKHTAELEREVADKDMEIEHVKKRCVILSESYDKTMVERAQLERQVADLTHECDGLRNRLAELNEAGITRLHRLLREAMGEAKNITHNARVYIDKQQGSKDDRCGDCGTDSGCDSCVCGAERAGERVLSEEPPAQEMSEREVVIERLREIDFAQKNVYLGDIGCAVLGRDPALWWSDESRAALRDKLIELIGGGGAE